MAHTNPAIGLEDWGDELNTALDAIDANADSKIPKNILTAKGDLLTRDDTGLVKKSVGATGFLLVADAANATGFAWTDPNTISGLQGPPGQSSGIYQYMFTDQPEPPANGEIRMNVVSPALQSTATKLWLSHETYDGVDVIRLLEFLGVGSKITLQKVGDTSIYNVYSITAAPVQKTGYTEFTVAWARGNGEVPYTLSTVMASTSSGTGLPAGGSANQVLTKNSATDYDVSWKTPSGGTVPVATKTANYTLTPADKVILVNGTSLTMTLPAAASNNGVYLVLRNIHASSAATVNTAGGNVNGGASVSLSAGTPMSFISDGSGWWSL